jgi:cytochrome c553
MRAKPILKWFGIIIGGIVGLAALGVAIIYVMIGRDLSRTFDVAVAELAVPVDHAAIEEGERLAHIHGCSGCHGDEVRGQVFFELFDGTTYVAPDLAAAAQKYSIAELDRVVRHGVRPDGTSVLLPMPSDMFYNLSDREFGSIIEFLRSQAPGTEPLPESYLGPVARVMLTMFKQETGTILSAEAVDHDAPRPDSSPENPESFGKYIAMTSCTECHGMDLLGAFDGEFPPLTIVAAYSLEDFTTLMRTGVPIGGRELDLMATVAVSRFSHFTDMEIAALHTFLKTLVNQ